MALRPARTCRSPNGQPWTRISRKRPRKSFVKGAPDSRVRQYQMGTDKRYELEARLVALQPVQIRDVSIESARQAANKFLESKLVGNYYLQVVTFPHFVLREHSALGVAGADRISKGMKLAFGRPKGRLARVRRGDCVFLARIASKDLPVLREAFNRARRKLSGSWKLVIRDISRDAANLARKEHSFKKREEEKPKEGAAAPASAAASAATSAGTSSEGVAAKEGAQAKSDKK
ncbi:MAG: 50S ribosomal protein L16 [Candidatus Norongarragalinales archaeon]